MEQNQQQWTTIIKPRTGWFDIDLKELWQYRDLVVMFVKRSFATLYKQTILGPAWILINPLLTTVIFTVVFGNIAGLAESGVPIPQPTASLPATCAGCGTSTGCTATRRSCWQRQCV